MRSVLLTGLAAFVSLPTSACDLELIDPWIRQAPPQAVAWAGYVELKNTGSKTLAVVAARSTEFASVELHESLHEGGVMLMRALERIEIPAGQSLKLEPHGKHLMLMEPEQAGRIGAKIPVTLVLDTGCEMEAEFEIRADAARGATEDAKGHHHHH